MRSGVRGLPGAAARLHQQRDGRHRRRVLVHAGHALPDRDPRALERGRAGARPDRSAREPHLCRQRRCDRRARQRRDPDPLSHRERHPPLEDDAVRGAERRRVRRRQLHADRVRVPGAVQRLRGRVDLLLRRSVDRQQLQDEVRRPLAGHGQLRELREHHRSADAEVPDLHEGPGAELSAAGRLRAADPQTLRRRDAAHRRHHVPHHRRAAHERDDRGDAARRAGAADRRDEGVPRADAPVGRLQHGSVVRRGGAAQGPRALGTQPPEARHPRRAADGGVRIVELDDAVGESAAGTQLLHDQAVDVPVVRRSVRAQVEQHRAERRNRDRLVRARAARQADLPLARGRVGGPADLDGAEMGRRPLGAALRHLLRHRSKSAAPRRQPAARPDRSRQSDDDDAEVRPAAPPARHHVLLARRLEDDGGNDGEGTDRQLHDGRRGAAAAAAAPGREHDRDVGRDRRPAGQRLRQLAVHGRLDRGRPAAALESRPRPVEDLAAARGARELLRDDVHGDGRHRLPLVAAAQGAGQLDGEQLGQRAVRRRDRSVRVAALSHRRHAGRRNRAHRSIGHAERLGMGGQRLQRRAGDAGLLLVDGAAPSAHSAAQRRRVCRSDHPEPRRVPHVAARRHEERRDHLRQHDRRRRAAHAVVAAAAGAAAGAVAVAERRHRRRRDVRVRRVRLQLLGAHRRWRRRRRLGHGRRAALRLRAAERQRLDRRARLDDSEHERLGESGRDDPRVRRAGIDAGIHAALGREGHRIPAAPRHGRNVGEHDRHDDADRAVLGAAGSLRQHVYRVSIGGRRDVEARRLRYDRDGGDGARRHRRLQPHDRRGVGDDVRSRRGERRGDGAAAVQRDGLAVRSVGHR